MGTSDIEDNLKERNACRAVVLLTKYCYIFAKSATGYYLTRTTGLSIVHTVEPGG